jgi:hypothetical protein
MTAHVHLGTAGEAFIFRSPQPMVDALAAVCPQQHDAHVGRWRSVQQLADYRARSAALREWVSRGMPQEEIA